MSNLSKKLLFYSDFWKLKHVCLREHHINGSGIEGELKEMCPNIEEIDLSKNLLNSWYSVSIITAQLSKLKILNLRLIHCSIVKLRFYFVHTANSNS